MKPRVIPVLFIRDKKVINTLRYKGGCYVGDPINTARLYNDLEVDELIILDGDASKQRREPDYQMIDKIRQQCFFPVSYGGGISTLESAKNIFHTGVEKVIVNSALMENPKIIRAISEYFGSQSLCLSFDLKQDWFGQYRVFMHREGKVNGVAVDKVIRNICQNTNPGEVMISAVHRDGSRKGFDLKMLDHVKSMTGSIPLILNGGAASLEHLKSAIEHGAHAVAGTTFFVTKQNGILINYPTQKQLTELFGEK